MKSLYTGGKSCYVLHTMYHLVDDDLLHTVAIVCSKQYTYNYYEIRKQQTNDRYCQTNFRCYT